MYIEKLYKTKKRENNYLKYIICICICVFTFTFFASCASDVPLVNTPTPMPDVELSTPENTPNATVASNGVKFIEFNNDYPTPKIMGNIGSNIENNGLAVFSDKRIYYVDNGLWSMTRDGKIKTLLSDMQYIAFLNNVGEYIYFISTHDTFIYRVLKDGTAKAEQLPISSAYDLLVIDAYIYYKNVSDNVDNNVIYRCDIDGKNPINLGIHGATICPDGVYIYFSNLDDGGKLYRYNTIDGKMIKLRSDRASQINVIKDIIYYIDLNDGKKLVSIERTGAGKTVIVDEAISNVNHVDEQLIYIKDSDDSLYLHSISDDEVTQLIENTKITSLNVADSWIIFESFPIEGLEAQVYRYNVGKRKIFPQLPIDEYALITNVDIENSTIMVDYVEFYIGEDAIKQYSLDNNISKDSAVEFVEYQEEFYYIHNPKVLSIEHEINTFTPMTMLTKNDAKYSDNEYKCDLKSINDVFIQNPALVGELLFKIKMIDDKIVCINQVFYPLDIEDK